MVRTRILARRLLISETGLTGRPLCWRSRLLAGIMVNMHSTPITLVAQPVVARASCQRRRPLTSMTDSTLCIRQVDTYRSVHAACGIACRAQIYCRFFRPKQSRFTMRSMANATASMVLLTGLSTIHANATSTTLPTFPHAGRR